MPDAHRVDINKLEKKITALSDALAHLSTGDDFRKLIEILRRPGWTTPAEFLFASAIVDAMQAQAVALTTLKGELLKGSQAVTAKTTGVGA
jgi:hypothetical protein